MVAVAVPPNAHVFTVLNLDVCLVDELFWFDAAELDTIPIEAPDPGPSREEEAQLATIAKQFGDQLTSEWAARDNATLRDHLIHRLKSQSPPWGRPAVAAGSDRRHAGLPNGGRPPLARDP